MVNNETPSTFKMNVFRKSWYTTITGYLNRTQRICSNVVDLENEINYIQKLFENNNYSSKMTSNEIENFKYRKK